MILTLLLLNLFTGVGALQVTQHPPSLHLYEGDTASMACDVSKGDENEIIRMFWYRNGNTEPLQNSTRITVTPNSLAISSVTAGDTGLYTCSALPMKHFTPVSGSGTYLTVIGVPQVTQHPPSLRLYEGGTASMACDVSKGDENESVTIFWYMNGTAEPLQNSTRVTVTQSSLVISNVTANDTELYICSVLPMPGYTPVNGSGTYVTVIEHCDLTTHIRPFSYNYLRAVLVVLVPVLSCLLYLKCEL